MGNTRSRSTANGTATRRGRDSPPSPSAGKLKNSKSLAKFRERLDSCRFAAEGEVEKLYADLGIYGQWVNMQQAQMFKESHPQLDRDMAADVLLHVFQSKGEVLLQDSLAFAGDSLFCEWAYVVDLDKGAFEVYRGFQTEPNNDRFAGLPRGNNAKYHTVKFVGSWPFDKLPTKREFLAYFECLARKEDEEDAAQ